VLHHAILNVCASVFERFQIDSSCATRPGRGTRYALTLARRYTRSNRYYLKLDVRQYFG